MHLRLLDKHTYKLYAISSSKDNCELLTFLNELPKNYHGSRDQLYNIFLRACKNGPGKLSLERSKNINKDPKIYEFRAYKIRVLWFYDEGKVIVCTHGFIKQTQKAPPSEKEKAIKLREKYFEAKKINALKFLED